MYEEDDGSNGPKGSFENFKAEGDVLFKKEEFQKALNSYTTALDLRPGDKNCLVARSQCYLELGNADAALADAEQTLSDDKNFIQGLKQKAQALYTKGNFEFALVFYQRGYKLRPEVKEFRLGIQKSQEAIENSIGDMAGLQLKNEGDLSYFYQEEQKNKKAKPKQGGYNRAVVKQEEKKQDRKDRAGKQNSKTIKQLLGELYADKEYLEKLWEETETGKKGKDSKSKNNEDEENQNDTNAEVNDLAASALDYLDSRAEFWQQQKPMYARRNAGKQGGKQGGKQDPGKYILKSLEEIDDAQAEGRFQESLKKAKKVLKEVESMSEEDVANRLEVAANLHSCIGNAYLELGDFGKAKEHHNKDREIAEQNDLQEAKSRALDNLGRVHARMGEYDKAIQVWEEKLPMSKSALESTWLYHEIGRCHLEKGRYQEAKECGEKSMEAAEEANDPVWQLNASVLIAQSQVKLEDYHAALDSFEISLKMAKKQKDSLAETAIKKAIEDVNQKIAKKEREEEGEGGEEEEQEQETEQEKDKSGSDHEDAALESGKKAEKKVVIKEDKTSNEGAAKEGTKKTAKASKVEKGQTKEAGYKGSTQAKGVKGSKGAKTKDKHAKKSKAKDSDAVVVPTDKKKERSGSASSSSSSSGGILSQIGSLLSIGSKSDDEKEKDKDKDDKDD